MRIESANTHTKYKVYDIMVSVLELWLKDNGIKASDAEWIDLLERLAEVERQLGE